MAKYITLKVEDEAFEELKLHTKHSEVWLGSPTGDWSPKRAFLESIEPSISLNTPRINITLVDDETFDNLRQATEQVIRSAFQAGANAMNAEDYTKDFMPTSSLNLKED